MVEIYKSYKQGKTSIERFRGLIYGLKAIGDMIEKETNIERLEELEKELKELKEVIK